MAFTAFFMLVLYPSLLLWCSRPEFDVKIHDFNESPPTPLDLYRARKAGASHAAGENDDLRPTGSEH